jgi:hypothetical protein
MMKEYLFWNVYERAINKLPRTTNSLEGFHGSLDNLFTVANSDLGFLEKDYTRSILIAGKNFYELIISLLK